MLGRSREFFLPPLAPRYVQDLCRTQVDGLVILEAFDSDMLRKRLALSNQKLLSSQNDIE